METVYQKGQILLYFLRRFRYLHVCNRLLQMFYQYVVARTIFFAVVFLGTGINVVYINFITNAPYSLGTYGPFTFFL